MPIVIEELHTEAVVEPDAAGAGGHGAAAPTEAAPAEAVLDLLDLVRERELRLACD
ncbi:MAG: hypothetical protein RLZZ584_3960 [Pseudomonadota bacterium]|jgi:hypothetical protein